MGVIGHRQNQNTPITFESYNRYNEFSWKLFSSVRDEICTWTEIDCLLPNQFIRFIIQFVFWKKCQYWLPRFRETLNGLKIASYFKTRKKALPEPTKFNYNRVNHDFILIKGHFYTRYYRQVAACIPKVWYYIYGKTGETPLKDEGLKKCIWMFCLKTLNTMAVWRSTRIIEDTIKMEENGY
jgi:hypothetical protein